LIDELITAPRFYFNPLLLSFISGEISFGSKDTGHKRERVLLHVRKCQLTKNGHKKGMAVSWNRANLSKLGGWKMYYVFVSGKKREELN